MLLPGMGGAGQGGIGAVPPAVVSLCSFAGVQRSILSHYPSVPIGAIKQTCCTLMHLLTFYNMLKKCLGQLRKKQPKSPAVTTLLFNVDFTGKLSKQ